MRSYPILLFLLVSLVVITFVAENEVSAAPAPCGFCPFRRRPHRRRDDDDDDDEDRDKPDKEKDKEEDKDKDKDKPKKDPKKAVKDIEKAFEEFLNKLKKDLA